METTTATVMFQTKPTDGLHELVHRAAKAAASDALDHGGMLEIHPAEAAPYGGHRLVVGASFSDDGMRRTIANLDVHVRLELDRLESRVVELAVSLFGGRKYTNLCFATPLALKEEDEVDLLRPRTTADDALDITIDCSAGIPFYATNLALTSSELAPGEVEAAVHCLRQLGVAFSRSGKKSIRVRKRQLRGPVRAKSLAAALTSLAERELAVSLYSATIPTTQSVRFAWRPEQDDAGKRQRFFEICVSRGLAGIEGTSKEQVLAIDAFIQEHFDVRVGERQWAAESRKWTAGSEQDTEPEKTKGR